MTLGPKFCSCNKMAVTRRTRHLRKRKALIFVSYPFSGTPQSLKHISICVIIYVNMYVNIFVKEFDLNNLRNQGQHFGNCFKSRFEQLERCVSTRASKISALRFLRCFVRRVTAILLQEKNFGPNVIYNVFVTQAEAQPKHWITYKYNEFKQYVLSMPYGTDIFVGEGVSDTFCP